MWAISTSLPSSRGARQANDRPPDEPRHPSPLPVVRAGEASLIPDHRRLTASRGWLAGTRPTQPGQCAHLPRWAQLPAHGASDPERREVSASAATTRRVSPSPEFEVGSQLEFVGPDLPEVQVCGTGIPGASSTCRPSNWP